MLAIRKCGKASISTEFGNCSENCFLFTWRAVRNSVIFIDVSCWSTKMFRSLSSMVTLLIFWIAFKVCRDRSILLRDLADLRRLPQNFLRSLVLWAIYVSFWGRCLSFWLFQMLKNWIQTDSRNQCVFHINCSVCGLFTLFLLWGRWIL